MQTEFTIDKHWVRQGFGKAAKGYDDFAQLQRIVAQALVQKSGLTQLHGNVLDIGCGTGYLTQILKALENTAWFLELDIALPMLQVARTNAADYSGYICADAEFLPLQTASFDFVVSNLALQWCQNLTQVLDECQRILKPDGHLLFSTFGAQTLIELKQAWAEVDDYRHVNDFYSERQVHDFLHQSGWQKYRIEKHLYRIEYSSVAALMRELKGLGAHNMSSERNLQLTGKSKMQQLLYYYPKLTDSDQIFASFEVIWVIAERRGL